MAGKRGNGEGCISQLKDGYWEARITIGYNEKGKQKFKTFNGKTRAIVAKKLNDYIANKKSLEPEQASKDTVGQWLVKWYDSYVANNTKTSTRVSYESIINTHLIPNIGHLKLKDLKKIDIEGMYNKLITSGRADGKGGLSVKTVNNISLVLHKALEEAMQREYIIKNPATISKVPTMRSTNSLKKEIEVYTRDEQKALMLECADTVYGTAIITALYTGVRLGELLAMQWGDIDFDSKTINISKQLNRLKDYSPNPKAKTRLGIQDDTKTKTSSRTISINDYLIEKLKSHRELQQTESKKWGKAYHKLNMVFSREDGYYIDPTTFRDNYKKILGKANVKQCTIHALRHTFATRALEAGIPIKVVSMILGHASVQITMDTYACVK